jgi:hypothetical protein
VQGFLTNEREYIFMTISKTGVVRKSGVYDGGDEEGARTVFNFIVKLVDDALKNLRTVAHKDRSEKVGLEVDTEDEEAWNKIDILNPSSPETVPSTKEPIPQLEPITFPILNIPNYREEAWNEIHPPTSFDEPETVPSDKEEIMDLPPIIIMEEPSTTVSIIEAIFLCFISIWVMMLIVVSRCSCDG